MTRWTMVADLRRCVGCQTCTAACRHANATPPGVQWRRVLDMEFGEYPDVQRAFVPVGCQHCDEPPCMEVCPTKATKKRADGIVTIDYDLCIGCSYCAVACPYQARYKTERASFAYGQATASEAKRHDESRLAVATKCTFCVERIDSGMAQGGDAGLRECVHLAGTGLRRPRRRVGPGDKTAHREPALPHARGARHRPQLLLPVGPGGCDMNPQARTDSLPPEGALALLEAARRRAT
jgi:phenylacetyl-CoA:acceptor oxidoreductase 27-kDa subunit